jgi:hypothetical protein
MGYQIYGDYALVTETLLEEFDNKAEAIRWVQGYIKHGDLGGYESIEVMRILESGESVTIHLVQSEELID